MTNRIIQGTYSDFKIVKTRSVAQVIIEVPLDQANQFVQMFGLPQPHEELWVAVAAIDRVSVEKNASATKAVQMAGILCNEFEFGEWLRNERGMAEIQPNESKSIADGLRAILGIRSRTEFHDNPDHVVAFNRLKGEYEEYKLENNLE